MEYDGYCKSLYSNHGIYHREHCSPSSCCILHISHLCMCTELFLFILNIIHNIPLYSLIKSSWHFFIILSGEKMSSNLSHGACLYLHNWSSWVHVFCMSICFTVCFYIDLWFTVWLDYFIREYMLIILLHYLSVCLPIYRYAVFFKSFFEFMIWVWV